MGSDKGEWGWTGGIRGLGEETIKDDEANMWVLRRMKGVLGRTRERMLGRMEGGWSGGGDVQAKRRQGEMKAVLE